MKQVIKVAVYNIKEEERQLLKKLLEYINIKEYEVIDLQSYNISLTKNDKVIAFGKAASLQIPRTKKCELLYCPNLSSLLKNGDNAKTRKEVVTKLKKFLEEKKNGKIQQIKLKLLDNKWIIAGKEKDLEIEELKELLDLLKNPIFKEVEIEFETTSDNDS